MEKNQPPDTLVLFGASGDLTQRKLLPALYQLYRAGRLPEGFRLVGYGRADMDDAAFRNLAGESLVKFGPGKDGDYSSFLAELYYRRGGYNDDEGLARLSEALRDRQAPIYYLALPPSTTEEVLNDMAQGKLPTENARIMLEKPFGIDIDSARRFNRMLAGSFPESHIHRIDHYLAKDTVRNLLVFRFANILFEPIWHRHYVDHIQVSATETIGVENRGGFYDGVGVVRDMLQNHVLLMLAFAAMEPPLAGDSESIRDRLADLLQSINPPGPNDFLFGQYKGYREAKGVRPDSTTPTFSAVRLYINNWRWYGVPIYLMSGKCLDERVSEITLVFKQIPVCLLENDVCPRIMPCILTLRIHPSEGIRLTLGVKAPGYVDDVLPANLDVRYIDLLNSGNGKEDKQLFSGYERVLLDALGGRPGLSWRADGIESAWRIVEPILAGEKAGIKPTSYPAGSSGAVLAGSLLARDGRQWYGTEF